MLRAAHGDVINATKRVTSERSLLNREGQRTPTGVNAPRRNLIGYSHYIQRPRELPVAEFTLLRDDAQRLIEAAQQRGIKLGDAWGQGHPVVSRTEITLNGLEACGHDKNESVVIPCPAANAGGLGEEGEDAISGQWFAGSELITRVCNGNCSYETFSIPRIMKIEKWQTPTKVDGVNLYFDFCKTAYRPYDLVVTAILLAAKHRLKNRIRVSSDGTDAQWWDTKLFTFNVLGFGPEYAFRPEEGGGECLVQVHDSAEAALNNIRQTPAEL